MKTFGIKNKSINQNEILLIDLMIKALTAGRAPNRVQIFQIKDLIQKLQENDFEVDF